MGVRAAGSARTQVCRQSGILAQMGNRGYTLVELLVVIAIIAVLAAMIAPVLLQAKDSARMSSCAENLRQMGKALQFYMDDNDGFGIPSPPLSYKPYKNPWILNVRPLVPQYVPQAGVPFASDNASLPYDMTPSGAAPRWVWVCPGDMRPGLPSDTSGAPNPDFPCWVNFGSSYLYPGPTAYQSGNSYQDRVNVSPRKPLLWKNHKRDILLSDFYVDLHNGAKAERDPTWLTPYPQTWVEVKSVNALFLDQHLSAITPAQRRVYLKTFLLSLDNPYVKP